MATIHPTWSRFLKMWKQVVYPVITKNINVYSWDQPSFDEEYEITTTDIVDNAKITSIINQIQEALISRGYNVTNWEGKEDCDLTINGKDRYAPSIDISISVYELEDDVILDWDDGRWTTWVDEPQDEFGFKPDYSKWIKEHGIIDTYENIRRAPSDVQESYCDWVRSTDFTRLWITITYVE